MSSFSNEILGQNPFAVIGFYTAEDTTQTTSRSGSGRGRGRGLGRKGPIKMAPVRFFAGVG